MSLVPGQIGRDDQKENIIHDAPNKTVETMLHNQDLIIQALKDIADKLDADTGVTDTDYNAIAGALKQLKMII